MYLLLIKKASRCWKHCWLVPKIKRNSYGKQIDKPSKENLLLTKNYYQKYEIITKNQAEKSLANY